MKENERHWFWATKALWDALGVVTILLGIVFALTQCSKCQHDYDPMNGGKDAHVKEAGNG